jgi:hypothetical protein
MKSKNIDTIKTLITVAHTDGKYFSVFFKKWNGNVLIDALTLWYQSRLQSMHAVMLRKLNAH